MNLYNQYCYPDISDVASSIKSELVFIDGYMVFDAVASGVDSVDVSYYQISKPNIIDTVTRTFPACDRLGFDNTYTVYPPKLSRQLF